MALCDFDKISADLSLKMKKINTVVEEWPTRLKLQLGEKGAEAEFRLLLGSGYTTTEHYVEWKRTLGRPGTSTRDVGDTEEKFSATKRANCDILASMRCTRCVDAPVYAPDEDIGVVYCSRDCQTRDWQNHKPQCNVLERRKKLIRIATILKATLLAYRECVFDIDLESIEFRDGTLRLLMGSTHDRPFHTHFPSHLTANLEHREVALANNQCTLAMALLGPLARQLLTGKSANYVPFYLR